MREGQNNARYVCVCRSVCVWAYGCMCMRACVRAYARACKHAERAWRATVRRWSRLREDSFFSKQKYLVAVYTLREAILSESGPDSGEV